MVKEVRIYIGRDRGSLELFRTINEILRSLPPGERPRLKVKTFKIKNPAEFKAFIKQLEELFGGMYTVEIRKYGIEAIPAIVVDGEKVLEGKYPTPEELRELILGVGALLESPAAEQPAPPPIAESKVEEKQPPIEIKEVTPIPPVAPTTIEEPTPPAVEVTGKTVASTEEEQPVELKVAPEAVGEEPEPRAPPLSSVEEGGVKRGVVVEPEEFKLDEEPLPPLTRERAAEPSKPPLAPPPSEEQIRRIEPTPLPRLKPRPPPPSPPVKPKPPSPPAQAIVPPVESAPRRPPEEVSAPETREEKVDLSKTCLTCIFYSKERKRCTLYHIPIEDPYHPPPICERVKK